MSEKTQRIKAPAARKLSLAPAEDPEWISLEADCESGQSAIALKTLDCQSLAVALLQLSTQQARRLEPEKVLASVQEQFQSQMRSPVEALGAVYKEDTGELLVTTGIGVLRFLIRPESQAQAKDWLRDL